MIYCQNFRMIMNKGYSVRGLKSRTSYFKNVIILMVAHLLCGYLQGYRVHMHPFLQYWDPRYLPVISYDPEMEA